MDHLKHIDLPSAHLLLVIFISVQIKEILFRSPWWVWHRKELRLSRYVASLGSLRVLFIANIFSLTWFTVVTRLVHLSGKPVLEVGNQFPEVVILQLELLNLKELLVDLEVQRVRLLLKADVCVLNRVWFKTVRGHYRFCPSFLGFLTTRVKFRLLKNDGFRPLSRRH